MEAINFAIDIVLIICGVLATWYAWSIGGSIGHGSLKLMAGGFLLLGLAHFAETLVFLVVPDLPFEAGEIIHRVIVLVSFVMILIGYQRLAKFVRS
ncbi:MAG: hypothetical protein AAB793_00230 [Patescibacteria group bacterium]